MDQSTFEDTNRAGLKERFQMNRRTKNGKDSSISSSWQNPEESLGDPNPSRSGLPRQLKIPEYQSSDEEDNTETASVVNKKISRFSEVLKNNFQTLYYELLLSTTCIEFVLNALKAFRQTTNFTCDTSHELMDKSTQEYGQMYDILRKAVMTFEIYFDAEALLSDEKTNEKIKFIFGETKSNLESSISNENQKLLCEKLDEFSRRALERLQAVKKQCASKEIIETYAGIMSKNMNSEIVEFQKSDCRNQESFKRSTNSLSNPVHIPKPEFQARHHDSLPLKSLNSFPKINSPRNELELKNSQKINDTSTGIAKSDNGTNIQGAGGTPPNKTRINLKAVKRTPSEFVPQKAIDLYENIIRTHLESITIEELGTEDENTFFGKINDEYERREKFKLSEGHTAQVLKDAKKLYDILEERVGLMEKEFKKFICFTDSEITEKCNELFNPEESADVPSHYFELFTSKMGKFSKEYVQRNEVILRSEMNPAALLIDGCVEYYCNKMEENLADTNNLSQEELENLHSRKSEAATEKFIQSCSHRNPRLSRQLNTTLKFKIEESKKWLLDDYELRRPCVEVEEDLDCKNDEEINAPKETNDILFDELYDLPIASSPTVVTENKLRSGPDDNGGTSYYHDNGKSDGSLNGSLDTPYATLPDRVPPIGWRKELLNNDMD